MARTLYVGNLPWSITVDELRAAVSGHGRVESCRIITDAESGRSRGFGFVEVADEDADRVVRQLNGTVLGNREIVVNEAKVRRAPRASVGMRR